MILYILLPIAVISTAIFLSLIKKPTLKPIKVRVKK